MNRRQRRERLEETRTERRTLIFYEAPHKLTSTLADLLEAFGDRSVTVCRELTKLHEEIWKTTLSAALTHYTENTPKGEFVLVIAGAPAPVEHSWTLEEAVALAEQLTGEGSSPTAACRQAAAAERLCKE